MNRDDYDLIPREICDSLLRNIGIYVYNNVVSDFWFQEALFQEVKKGTITEESVIERMFHE